jgi:hypothetical protein
MGKTGANVTITGEPWFECAICGFDFPYAERMRHYKTGLLVDSRCMDEPTHHDYWSEFNPYDTEYERISEQPVSNQGPDPGIDDLVTWGGPQPWRTGKWKHG